MRKKILIVDDDADDRDLFEAAARLVDKDVECHKADGADDAYTLFQKGFRPDLIFLDLNMPEISGKQFLQKLKKDNGYASIPVVIYTTSKLREDEQELKEIGATVFFTKPSKLDDLKHNIGCVLQKKYDQIRSGVNTFTKSGGLGV